MNHPNNNPGLDHPGLAMLCGVVPPQYREGASQPFAAWVNKADRITIVPHDGEPEPASADESRLSSPRL